MDQDHESVYIVVLKSTGLGAGGQQRAQDVHDRNLLRALHMNCQGARVFRAGSELTYDPAGDDMGHHGPEHDRPVLMRPDYYEQSAYVRRLDFGTPEGPA